MMPTHDSVTTWLTQLKAGEITALANIQRRYWPYMLKLAGQRLGGSPRRYADEEDAAQEALIGFYQTIKQGGFPRLVNRHDLLVVLTVVTARKTLQQLETAGRQKRGAGRVLGESALDLHFEDGMSRGLEQLAGREISPGQRAALHELYVKCLSVLPDNWQPIAKLYLSGHSYPEIAQAIGCVPRTVERKISLIVRRWQALVANLLEESSENL